MRKQRKSMAAMLIAVVCALVTLTGCGDDPDAKFAYFQLSLEEYNVGSSGNANIVSEYIDQVGEAYRKALELSESNTLYYKGNYGEKAAVMKDRFNNAQLPQAPEYGGKYSFKYVLYGTSDTKTGSTARDVIASKTFASAQK